MRRIPVETPYTTSVTLDTVTVNFNGGEMGDIVYLTVVRGDTTNWELLSVTQIVNGLDHENQPAAQSGYAYYNMEGFA